MPGVPIKKRKQRGPLVLPGGKRRLITERELGAQIDAGRRKTRELVALRVFIPIPFGPHIIRFDQDQVDEAIRKIASGEIVVSELKDQKVSEPA